MKKLILSFVAVLVAGSVMSAQAQQIVKGDVSSGEQELLDRDLDNALAPIRSKVDLDRYLASRQISATPLAALSSGSRQRFLQSLIFGQNGLASFDDRDIRNELTATQAYRLLALFGVQRSTPAIPGLKVKTRADELILLLKPDAQSLRATDYQDYKCESRATCAPAIGLICIGANC